jgi:hypothetical protein
VEVVLSDVAITPVGALGDPIGITAAVAVAVSELPVWFCATIVMVYDVPFAKPVTTHDGLPLPVFAGIHTHSWSPGLAATT